MVDLILTGWSYNHAAAAAIAWSCKPEAQLRPISERKFPQFIQDLSRKRELEIKRIVILGISLKADETKLLKGLKSLKRKKIELVWLSAIEPGVDQEIIDCFSDHRLGDCLNNLVANYFGTRKNSAVVQRANLLVQQDERVQNFRNLIEATSYRHRVFQESESYIQAIKTILLGGPISSEQDKLIKHYEVFGHRELKGKSKWIEEVKALAKRVGPHDCKVLITGETGTGKETIATLIHSYSNRYDDSFIPFNCADLSPQLLESRLFGHEKGAFTGADRERKGAFELADGGTLFLDEVGELSMDAQAGLLRVLQDGKFFRVGSETERKVDARVIAATNRNLPQMVKAGTFREDLFYRLNTIQIHAMPLRDRMEDLEDIANNCFYKKHKRKLNAKQLQDLSTYSWPGNIRELQNILDRAYILGESDFQKLLKQHRKMMSSDDESIDETLDGATKRHMQYILDKYDGHKTNAIKALGITINTLNKKLFPSS